MLVGGVAAASAAFNCSVESYSAPSLVQLDTAALGLGAEGGFNDVKWGAFGVKEAAAVAAGVALAMSLCALLLLWRYRRARRFARATDFLSLSPSLQDEYLPKRLTGSLDMPLSGKEDASLVDGNREDKDATKNPREKLISAKNPREKLISAKLNSAKQNHVVPVDRAGDNLISSSV